MSRKEPTVNDIVRVGLVSAVYAERGTATVTFPDRGNVSKELPILQWNTLRNRDEHLLDPGEQVVCLFYGNGPAEGVIVGATYAANNPPPIGDRDKRRVEFDDGTVVEYDRKEHVLTIDVKGDVVVRTEKDVSIEAAGSVHIRGAEGVAIVAGSGGATLQGNFSMRGTLNVTGSITASGSIIDGSGNTSNHSH